MGDKIYLSTEGYYFVIGIDKYSYQKKARLFNADDKLIEAIIVERQTTHDLINAFEALLTINNYDHPNPNNLRH